MKTSQSKAEQKQRSLKEEHNAEEENKETETWESKLLGNQMYELLKLLNILELQHLYMFLNFFDKEIPQILVTLQPICTKK